MQPRILVRQQGHNKKRFISPNQIRKNQLLYGDSLGSQGSIIGSSQNIASNKKIAIEQQYKQNNQINKVYSTQHQSSKIDNRQRSKPMNYQQGQQNMIVNMANQTGNNFQINNNGKILNFQQNKHLSRNQVNSITNTTSANGTKFTSPSSHQNQQYSSRSKQGKKDYMMSTLARFNNKSKKTKNQQQVSNSSQSRSKVNSIKNQKLRTQPSQISNERNQRTERQKQYVVKNVYNDRKQTGQVREIMRRPRNNDSQSSNGSANQGKFHKQSSQIQTEKAKYEYQRTKREYAIGKLNNHDQVEYQKIQQIRNNEAKSASVLKVQQKTRSNNQNRQQFKSLQKDNDNLFKFQQNKNINHYYRQSNQSNQFDIQKEVKKNYQNNYQKAASTQPIYSSKQNQNRYQLNRNGQENRQTKRQGTTNQLQRAISPPPSSQQQSNNSSMVFHLQKAHQQKQDLRSMKLQLQKQLNNCKQKIQTLQHSNFNLKRQLEQSNMQKLSLIGDLKVYKQYQNQSQNQLKDTNNKNQHLYRQIHQKYQSLLDDYKKAMAKNDLLQSDNSKLTTSIINLQKKNTFLEDKTQQLTRYHQKVQEQLKIQLKKTINQWKNKLQVKENQLRKYHHGEISQNGQNTGNIKIKMIEIQTQINHKNSLLSKRQQEIKNIRRQLAQKIEMLEEIIYKKQKQAKQTSSQISIMQQQFVAKSKQYQTTIKQLQVKLANLQKQLTKKRLQNQELKRSSLKQSQKLELNKIYSTNSSSSSKQAIDAQSSLNGLISSQTQQVNQTKKNLNFQIQQNFKLQTQIQEQKCAVNNLQQQLKILQMQYQSLQKRSAQSSSTDIALMRSQIQTFHKKQKILQQKIAWNVKQIKEKDNFIQTHLLRAVKQQNVPHLLQVLKQMHKKFNY